jgi:hypothetical protein
MLSETTAPMTREPVTAVRASCPLRAVDPLEPVGPFGARAETAISSSTRASTRCCSLEYSIGRQSVYQS